MYKTTFRPAPLDNYNAGQNIERGIRYTLTGELVKADNKKHTKTSDLFLNGIHYQIKSPKCTISTGIPGTTEETAWESIKQYIEQDAAQMFIFGTAKLEMYVMTKAEWLEFAYHFRSKLDHESDKEKTPKFRLRSCSNEMQIYLYQHSKNQGWM